MSGDRYGGRGVERERLFESERIDAPVILPRNRVAGVVEQGERVESKGDRREDQGDGQDRSDDVPPPRPLAKFCGQIRLQEWFYPLRQKQSQRNGTRRTPLLQNDLRAFARGAHDHRRAARGGSFFETRTAACVARNQYS